MSEPRDEVDDVVAAWRRERPDLDTAPMEVFSRVDRLARHVDRARAAAFSRHDLEGWEFDVLAALRRSGEPYRASPSALVRATGVTSGTMTNRVDRLAARGLVRRDSDPDDRRSVRVELTDSGRATVDGALVDLLDAERELLTGLAEPGRRGLAQALRSLLASYGPAGSDDGRG
jgi:DNA-binding MarR family transcriptional regulator